MKVKTTARKSTPTPVPARKIAKSTPRPAKRTAKAAKTPVSAQAALSPRDNSKQAQLIAALKATSGTTLKQMMAQTGWQAHTVRGTISGVIRKKLGLNVVYEQAGDSSERVYRIVGSAVSA